MDKPKITWYAKLAKEDKFNGGDNLFVGSNTPNNDLEINVQLWNNRWGETAVEDLEDFQIVMFFADYEDSALLPCLSAKYNNQQIDVEVDTVAKRAMLMFPITMALSGEANNGSSTDNTCLKNFLPFTIMFKHPGGKHLKENDLKSLRLEITRG